MNRELRRRVEVLHLRRLDATPPPPTPVLFLGDGETGAQAKERAGVPANEFCVLVRTVDASVPRV